MTNLLAYAASTLIALLLADAGLSLFGTIRRRVDQRRLQHAELDLFARRTQFEVATARIERERNEQSWVGRRKFRVKKKLRESPTVCSFYLAPQDGQPVPPFLPGQHLTFQLRIPGQSAPVVRCYSLSDSPGSPHEYRVTIKKIPPPHDQPGAPPGLASSYFHDTLEEGQTVDVLAPGGIFHLDVASDRPVVLIAGGVGLTPLLSMLNDIVRSGSERETWLVHGVLNRPDHLMYAHLKQVAESSPNVHLHTVYSNPTDDCRKGRDYDSTGYVTRELLEQILPSSNYEFYICGPPQMMASVTEGLREWGVPEGDVHFEAFGPSSVKHVATIRGDVPAETSEVRFARSGKAVGWVANGGSLLDLAEANGISIPFGCRGGSCGTCATAVVEGDVSYLIPPQIDTGAGTCLACIAVPNGSIAIDA